MRGEKRWRVRSPWERDRWQGRRRPELEARRIKERRKAEVSAGGSRRRRSDGVEDHMGWWPQVGSLRSTARRSGRGGISSSRVVTLGSIEIFNTHEWLPTRPTIYFKCQGGNKTVLPDVKKTHFLYVFKGEESWQVIEENVEDRREGN
ncbi:uncharacterized protein A4U43_C08F12550 [Asparagus officinalis]|nr:uncharacterized protein A4U43_C08F12550 [Asparagus officinalis]